jgi:hypothetical protein
LLVSLLYLLFLRALAVAALRLRLREFKELEIVVLHHELAVLRRQISRSGLDSVTASSSLRRASYWAEGGGRSSSVRAPCWVGIASLCGDDGRIRDGDLVDPRAGYANPSGTFKASVGNITPPLPMICASRRRRSTRTDRYGQIDNRCPVR